MTHIFSSNLQIRASWIAAAGIALIGAAAPTVIFAQDSHADAGKAKITKNAAKSEDYKKLIEQLGSSDFDERDAAMERLRDAGDAALPALDEAGTNHNDSEIRWNARRVAREIRRGETGKVKKLSDLGWQDGGGSQPGRARAKKGNASGPEPGIENDLDLTIPDLGADPDFAQMQKFFEGLQGSFRGNFNLQHNNSGTSISVGPEGVKVTVTEKDADGNDKTETYSAPSMEEFREKYPDIAKKHLDGISIFGLNGNSKIQIQPGPNVFKFRPGIPGLRNFNNLGADPAQGADDRDSIEAIIGPENGERLGVGVRLVPEAVAKFLAIDAETGFMVESVTSGSLAESLGLKANDLVLTIQGRKIGAGETTIREALASVPAGEMLKIQIVRGMEGMKTLEARKPKAAEARRTNR